MIDNRTEFQIKSRFPIEIFNHVFKYIDTYLYFTLRCVSKKLNFDYSDCVIFKDIVDRIRDSYEYERYEFVLKKEPIKIFNFCENRMSFDRFITSNNKNIFECYNKKVRPTRNYVLNPILEIQCYYDIFYNYIAHVVNFDSFKEYVNRFDEKKLCIDKIFFNNKNHRNHKVKRRGRGRVLPTSKNTRNIIYTQEIKLDNYPKQVLYDFVKGKIVMYIIPNTHYEYPECVFNINELETFNETCDIIFAKNDNDLQQIMLQHYPKYAQIIYENHIMMDWQEVDNTKSFKDYIPGNFRKCQKMLMYDCDRFLAIIKKNKYSDANVMFHDYSDENDHSCYKKKYINLYDLTSQVIEEYINNAVFVNSLLLHNNVNDEFIEYLYDFLRENNNININIIPWNAMRYCYDNIITKNKIKKYVNE